MAVFAQLYGDFFHLHLSRGFPNQPPFISWDHQLFQSPFSYVGEISHGKHPFRVVKTMP